MVSTGPARTRDRPGRGADTRERILAAAERLFAEHGIAAVSNRQIGEAAGQSNNYAVGYHFGTKTDLVRAVLRRHNPAMEERRAAMLAAVGDASGVREWASCLVRPATEHLASLPAPTWFARFLAQADTEPGMRAVVIEEAVAAPSLGPIAEHLFRLAPGVPEEVHRQRTDMCRVLVVHMLAERERALHEDPAADPATVWRETADALVDALAGLLAAPVTPSREWPAPPAPADRRS
ncbi:TetR family transcriptional regulator [Nonomuraea roseoviolacea subsp. roseoviolacea]|uniref:AcrR family transcriptional regulator n=1 Tax=Nonomuraea roseoviolacea subsp. carminata TaxID=160689 RepID=A0ABT1KBP6_9ACTN|nr:TetR/AcrR family transcriptional regulator [Nonomuraea roseoviolacea]MCP2351117.1 AcrR family transcriptional regulator [Nonomuraea roseoviolacea subsp. carminata]